ncbi:MAG: hypothetical protein CMJ75_06930 [Planctomycetaceae bacterium]|nr:hypothetical protein [Planctomycetaceae bacterium]
MYASCAATCGQQPGPHRRQEGRRGYWHYFSSGGLVIGAGPEHMCQKLEIVGVETNQEVQTSSQGATERLVSHPYPQEIQET